MQHNSMHTMHHHHADTPSPLDVNQLAEFDAALGDAPEDEKRRKRIVYLKDAAQKMQVGISMFKGFGFFLIPFAIIPIFWPFLAFVWFMRKKASAMMDAQFSNALDYWEIAREEVEPQSLDV